MADTDFYELLGVERGADAAAIKSAYRRQAMDCHPDRHGGCVDKEAHFKAISQAYDVLKDPQKRAAYDRFGHAAFEQGGPQAGGFNFTDGAGLGDIFDQMFGEFMGGRRGGGGQRTGSDVRAQVEIDLTEAFSGAKVSLRVPTRAPCEACEGTGSADKSKANLTCGTCNGAGKVRAQQGFFMVERTCPTCGGAGRVISNPCRVCQGQGTVQRERTLEVAIPAGVEDGTRIRLSGEGAAGPGGAPAGDLYVSVGVRAHEIFQRDGANLMIRLPLRMSQAALGGEVEVPVIDGSRAKMKVPAGTQTGDQFRLRGKGFSTLRSTVRGDMYVQVAVETPQNLTRKQRELLEAFEAEMGNKNGHPESEGFFTKVKEFFESASRG